MVVVLPAPFGPRNRGFPARDARKLTSSTAVTDRTFVRCWTSIKDRSPGWKSAVWAATAKNRNLSFGGVMSVDVGSSAGLRAGQPGSRTGHPQRRAGPSCCAGFLTAFSSVCTKELCTFRDSLRP